MPRSPESYLLSAILRTQKFVTATAAGVHQEMFHVYPDEWAFLQRFYTKYGRTPGKETFKHKFPDFTIQRTDDTGHYAEEVRKAHATHLLTSMMNDAAELLTSGDVDTAMKLVHSGVISAASAVSTVDEGDIIHQYRDVFRDIDERRIRYEEEGHAGIPFGMPALDEATGGANPGNLIILAGRLGHGKSWVGQLFAATAVMGGYNTLWNAMEQTRSEVTMRIHSLLSGQTGETVFANNLLMQGHGYDPKAYRAFLATLKRTIQGTMHVSDASRGKVSTTSLAAQIERYNPHVVYIDYITLMKAATPDWQGIAQISGELKEIAGKYKIPIIALAQLNREHGLGKEPASAEAIAQSDAIGQDADMVITLRQMSQSTMRMRLAKNRNGVGDVFWNVQFQPGKGIIKEVSRDTYERLQDKDADQGDKR